MDKVLLRHRFAENVKRAMKRSLRTQTALAKKASMSQGYVSELLRGMSAPTTDVIADMAHALGCQPWELLVDEEATRAAALKKMLGEPVDGNPLDAAPLREVAPKQRKKSGRTSPH